jgi:hypothetical protein
MEPKISGQRKIEMQPTLDSKYVNLPPLEKGFFRIVTHDSQIYDLPAASVAQAKTFDEDLRILQEA